MGHKNLKFNLVPSGKGKLVHQSQVDHNRSKNGVLKLRLVSIPGDPAVGREDLRLAGGLEGLPGHEPAPPPPPPGNIEEKLWLALGRGVAVALGTPLLRLGVLNAVEVGGGGKR